MIETFYTNSNSPSFGWVKILGISLSKSYFQFAKVILCSFTELISLTAKTKLRFNVFQVCQKSSPQYLFCPPSLGRWRRRSTPIHQLTCVGSFSFVFERDSCLVDKQTIRWPIRVQIWPYQYNKIWTKERTKWLIGSIRQGQSGSVKVTWGQLGSFSSIR